MARLVRAIHNPANRCLALRVHDNQKHGYRSSCGSRIGHRMRKVRILALIAIAAFITSPEIANSASSQCGLDQITNIAQLQAELSRRAVEAINLAAAPDAKDERLQQLVDPSATFESGSGDVGGLLGKGVKGIRALAWDMNADTFRSFDWGAIPYPISDPCTEQKINVEFVRTWSQTLFPVQFTFKAGRIVAARTWANGFTTGPVKPAHQ